jgi:hypothetical protein
MAVSVMNKKVAPRIGELMVREGFLKEEELKRALEMQRQPICPWVK